MPVVVQAVQSVPDARPLSRSGESHPAVVVQAVQSVPDAAEASVVLVTSEDVKAGLSGLGADAAMVRSAGFTGRADQVHSQPADGRILGLVGLGPAADVAASAFRRAGAAAARAWKRHHRVAVTLPDSDTVGVSGPAAFQALAEGVVLGGYRYTAFKSGAAKKAATNSGSPDDEPRLAHLDVVSEAGDSSQQALERGAAIAAGVCMTRDLVNEPGGSLTPPAFALRAESMAHEAGLEVEVWDESQIEQQRLGGLLGVNRGSTQPPRFVQIVYRPADVEGAGSSDGSAEAGSAEADGSDNDAGRAPTLALVGKGLTFDAGGLSVKTAQGMVKMKMDMAGAAAVLGAMSVLPAIAPDVTVRAYLPMTDNMLGGDATRPGDVLTIRNGKTIEVANTDAEGRLVLADALALACEHAPDAIVDLATLTGACMVALGPKIAGLMGNDDSWINRVRNAATAAGERVWPLPLPPDYESQFKSSVADMKNIGTAHGGALTAGLILQKFVAEGTAWAHLDIAGPAFADSNDGEICEGGTGFGVRTLLELIEGFASYASEPKPRPEESPEGSDGL